MSGSMASDEWYLRKKKTIFFPTLFLTNQKKQNKPTNPQSEFDSKSKPWNFTERESKRVLANLVVVVCCWCFELGICYFVL